MTLAFILAASTFATRDSRPAFMNITNILVQKYCHAFFKLIVSIHQLELHIS